MCFFVFFSVPALLLTFIASGFPERSNIGMASVFPEPSSLGIHGIEGTTQSSGFARASDITLRKSVSSGEPSNILLFPASIL